MEKSSVKVVEDRDRMWGKYQSNIRQKGPEQGNDRMRVERSPWKYQIKVRQKGLEQDKSRIRVERSPWKYQIKNRAG